MTQMLLNTLNNIQEMMNKPSLADIEKQLKTINNSSTKKNFDAMDKSSEKGALTFDNMFKKQLEKESSNSDSASDSTTKNKTSTCIKEDENSNSNTTTQTDLTIQSKNVNNDKSIQIKPEIKTLGEIKEIKNINLNELLNTIAQKIDDVIDCNTSTETLATLSELLDQVAEESTAESSLDLTLARDINELINQLQNVIEQVADKIESTTEGSCTAIVEDLISNIDTKENTDTEILSLEETTETLTNDIDNDESLKILDDLKEQLLAYVNKVESYHTKVQEENLSLAQKTTVESETISIEFNNDLIEFSTNIIEDSNIKTNNSTQISEIEIPLDEESLKELKIESIKAESNASDNNSSLMEHQTPEEYSIRASLNQDFESFEVNIDKTFETQNVQQTQIKPTEITPSKIIEQITKQMEGLQNNSKVNIVLNPESLGKVSIQLLRTGEGLSAQFTVASQEVKDMLMKGLDGLKETLTAQGIGVDNVSIKLNDTQKSSYNPDWTEQEGSRGGNKEQGRSNKDEKHKELFEQMMAQTDNENGNV